LAGLAAVSPHVISTVRRSLNGYEYENNGINILGTPNKLYKFTRQNMISEKKYSIMNKIIFTYLTASETLFKFAYSQTVVVLFLVLTMSQLCAAQSLKSANLPSENELPTLQTKAKPGLIRVQNNLVYGENNSSVQIGRAALVFDDTYAYVSTPNGLYRTPKKITANSSFELIGFQNKSITNLYVHNNVLYVLKYSEVTYGSRATDHSFLKSEDHGATFIPMDGALEDCYAGYCSFLTPTEAIFKDNLIFLNAGAGLNLQVSNNNGASWIPLSGNLKPNVCYHPAFEIIGTRVLVGGECPLDFAYLRGGTLRPDLLDWASPEQRPKAVTTPNLENRNVQFIENKPNSPDVYAGVEGGLLKSSDVGQSFRFVIRYGIGNSAGSYPYITNILFLSKSPNVIVIGGFDKARYRFFLAYSKDSGESWLDVSNKTQLLVGEPSNTTEIDSTHFISEDSEGRVLVGIARPETKTLTIIQLRVDVAAFR
jgi:hypothetical protein